MTLRSLAVVPPSHPGIRNGSYYYMSNAVLPSATAAAALANTLYYQPINIVGVINRIGIEVTTGAAGLCRVGLYANSGGLPGALIIDAGTVDTTNIAVVEATISDLVLNGAWVWMACVLNATPTTRTASVGPGHLLGGTGPGAGGKSIGATFAYAGLPSTATAPTGYFASGPAMFVRHT